MNAAYQKLCARLMMAGVPDARFDAAQLYTFVTGRDHRLDDGPTAEEASRLQVLAERRAGREPLQYLLGEWDFLDFTLKVGRDRGIRLQSVQRAGICPCRAGKEHGGGYYPRALSERQHIRGQAA